MLILSVASCMYQHTCVVLIWWPVPRCVVEWKTLWFCVGDWPKILGRCRQIGLTRGLWVNLNRMPRELNRMIGNIRTIINVCYTAWNSMVPAVCIGLGMGRYADDLVSGDPIKLIKIQRNGGALSKSTLKRKK